jgi:hypothetical protein
VGKRPWLAGHRDKTGSADEKAALFGVFGRWFCPLLEPEPPDRLTIAASTTRQNMQALLNANALPLFFFEITGGAFKSNLLHVYIIAIELSRVSHYFSLFDAIPVFSRSSSRSDQVKELSIL